MNWLKEHIGPTTAFLAVVAALVVVGFVVVGRLNRLATRATEAERKASLAELRAAGFSAARDATRKELEAQVESSEIMSQEIARLKKLRPNVEIIGAVSGTTGLVGVPLPSTYPQPPQVVAGQVPGVETQAMAPVRPCLVFFDEPMEIRFKGALADDGQGALVAVGEAGFWVLMRGASEPVKVWSAPLRLEVAAKPPAAAPGWGAGVIGLAGRWGWALGPAVGFPPARLFGLSLEATGGVGVGTGGEWAGALLGLVRW